MNGYDPELAVDVTRTASRLRDTLTAVSPALERVMGERVARPAVRALLAAYPTPTALRAAGPDRIEAALDAQTVTLRAELPNGRVIGELAVDLGRPNSDATRGPRRPSRCSSPTLSAGSW